MIGQANWTAAAERALLFLRQRQCRLIAISSPEPGSGTTTCVHALAAVAYHSGFRPIVIDLSQPATSERTHVSVSPRPGGPAAAEDGNRASYETIQFRFAAGDRHICNNAGWLRDQINQHSANFDLVVIDLPAIRPHHAAAVNPLPVMAEADCVLLVCEPGRIKHSVLGTAVRQIGLAGARIDGIIINRPHDNDAGESIVRLSRRVTFLVPPLSRWIERKLRSSSLFT